MLRKLLIAPLFLASAIFASANININWNHFGGTILQGDGATGAPSTWLAQLIWSPTSTPSAVDVSNPLVPSGPDAVLYSQPLNEVGAPGFLLGELLSQSSADSSRAGGFIYTRVFNIDFGSAAIPTYYGQSSNVDGPLVDVASNDPTATSHDPGRLVVGTLIVPEPGTYVLMALGGLFLWIRRMRAS
jgi:hypothetical protein